VPPAGQKAAGAGEPSALPGAPHDPLPTTADVPLYRYAAAVLPALRGRMLLVEGKAREADEAYRQAVAAAEELVDPLADNAGGRLLLAFALDERSRFLIEVGRHKDAEADNGRALELLDRGAPAATDGLAQRDALARCLSTQGSLRLTMNKAAEAAEPLTRARELLERLAAEHPRAPRYRAELAWVGSRLGSALAGRNQLADAEKAHDASVALAERLVADDPGEAEYHSLLAGTLNNRANVLNSTNQPAKARPLLEKAVEHQRTALKTWPHHPRYRRFLRTHHWVLAATLLRLGDHAAAARTAADIPALFPDDGGAYGQALDLVAACPGLVDKDPKLSAEQRRARTGEYLKEVGRLSREMARHAAKNAGVHNGLAVFLANYPDERVRDPARAVHHAEEAVRLAEREPNCWSTLALARYRTGNWKTAAEALDKAMQLRRPQVGVEDVLLLSMIRSRLGDKEPARQLYDQAAGWIAQNQPNNPELARRRTEAARVVGAEAPAKPPKGDDPAKK
jgi:tetratricopeptide (TPR) repeat protein